MFCYEMNLGKDVDNISMLSHNIEREIRYVRRKELEN